MKGKQKLIRDKIPEKAAKEGIKLITRTLNQDEFETKVKEKLVEEANEVTMASDREELINELADVLELVRTVASINRIKLKEIESQRFKKLKKNGGFKKKLLWMPN
ncbi:MAG: nucleoside triphosphate pyrophosphohydrolase [bacterium]|nr:nucleoside triphosphate pyrophosphohydrolase [bacterium]